MDHWLIYLPLGIIGLWRWGVWIVKLFLALCYRPYPVGYRTTVSIVVPVYNEDPRHFRTALESWVKNGVNEIVAVIDYTDLACQIEFVHFACSFAGARMVVTKKPGKRPALLAGSKLATSRIIALVDSDTVWEDNTLAQGLAAFSNPFVGAVATCQSAVVVKTTAQRYQNIIWQTRYLLEMRALTSAGQFFHRLAPRTFRGPAITCASGRTAFYRREALLPVIDGLVEETFLKAKCLSGDDKYLTREVQAKGWTIWYQHSAKVQTYAVESLDDLFKQQLRWARNSWRSDLKATFSPWIRRRPALLMINLDRFVSPFTLLLAPLFFCRAVIHSDWEIVALMIGWWSISRTCKLALHLRSRPQDIWFVQIFTLLTFVSALIRIHAFSTIRKQGWITRWDPNRNPIANIWGKLAGPALTFGQLAALSLYVLS